jgi:2-polyprenyl-3-methyl-5-hydroxy-6-metoxy-1,4-benzoquinol methylase
MTLGPFAATRAAMPEIEREPLSTRVVRALSRGPRAQRLEAPEVYGSEAIARIARSLPPLERVYANIRFSILRPKLLSVMDLMLPDEGRILDIGCGFGLFSAYFGQTQPARQILGVDPNAKRIETARHVAKSVGIDGSFVAGDARDVAIEGPFAGAYVLDVMHHIPEADQLPMLRRLRDLLAPRGVLVIKDITTEPAFGVEFTRLLDRVMVGWDEPLCYRHHREWGEMLVSLGFRVRMVRVPDVLPYPHVVIAATKL